MNQNDKELSDLFPPFSIDLRPGAINAMYSQAAMDMKQAQVKELESQLWHARTLIGILVVAGFALLWACCILLIGRTI